MKKEKCEGKKKKEKKATTSSPREKETLKKEWKKRRGRSYRSFRRVKNKLRQAFERKQTRGRG